MKFHMIAPLEVCALGWGHVNHMRLATSCSPLCPQLDMGIQPGARFHARSTNPLPATLYGHFTWVIYRNRPRSPRVASGTINGGSQRRVDG